MDVSQVEDINNFNSLDNGSGSGGQDLEFHMGSTKQKSENSDTIAADAADEESEHEMSDGTHHRSFISVEDECNECQSQFVKLKIPIAD